MTFEPIVFEIPFLEGAKGEKATFAKDNQDTLPMDITEVPTPEEPEVTFSPPTSTKGSAVHSVFRAGLLEFRKMRLARNHHVFD